MGPGGRDKVGGTRWDVLVILLCYALGGRRQLYSNYSEVCD